jgi:glycine cleavage system transcriptional repressor
MVAAVSKLLFDLGANLEDTAMTRLGGQFAMLMLFSDGDGLRSRSDSSGVPAKGHRRNETGSHCPLTTEVIERAIAAHRDQLESLGLHLHVAAIDDGEAGAIAEDTPRYLIRVSGADQPGIVYAVAQSLGDRQIDITDLSSRRLMASSGPIYLLLIEVVLPADCSFTTLATDLKRLQAQLGLEIQLEPIDAMTL